MIISQNHYLNQILDVHPRYNIGAPHQEGKEAQKKNVPGGGPYTIVFLKQKGQSSPLRRNLNLIRYSVTPKTV